MTTEPKTSRPSLPLLILASIAVLICSTLIFYRPDRAVPTITPGSSESAAFIVQIIRPRAGLPLGGLLPPKIFGLETHLGFDSKSPGASFSSFAKTRYEFRADNWEVVLDLDSEGRVTGKTSATFDVLFEDQTRKIRCRPDELAIGSFGTTVLSGSTDHSGSFDIELALFEDTSTGKSLGWPPQPFILHGSFDRFPLGPETD